MWNQNLFCFRVADDFATGTRAALAGGTTMVVELVDPAAEQSVTDALEEWREDAEQNSFCDYAFKVGRRRSMPNSGQFASNNVRM